MNYKKKYLKYKIKYLLAKKLYGGMSDGDIQPRERSDAVIEMETESDSSMNAGDSDSPRSDVSMNTPPEKMNRGKRSAHASPQSDVSMNTPQEEMNRGKRSASKSPPFKSPDNKKPKLDSPLPSPRTPPIQHFKYAEQPK